MKILFYVILKYVPKINEKFANLKTEFSIKNSEIQRNYEACVRYGAITQNRNESNMKTYFLPLCCFIMLFWSVLINVDGAHCDIPTEVSCGVSYIGQTKSCSFSVPNADYTLSISQPHQNVFSLPQTNIVGNKITFNFTPPSQDVFFAVIEVENNSTSEKKTVFVKGEGFSSDKVVVINERNLGYVFKEDNPKIAFEVQNLTELSTVYIKSNYSCEITYVIPKDKTRCSTTLNYSGQKVGSFSKVFVLELSFDGYEQNITFYVFGIWAYPNVSFEKNLKFPGVLVGRSQTKFIKLSNQGNYPLIISGAFDNPPFYLGRFPVYVESDFFLPITFTPNSAGYFSKSVTLITNIGYLVLDLEGYGVSNPFPTLFSESITVDFGILIPKETKVRSIEISNVGAENLVIRNIYIPPNNPFSLTPDLDFPLVLVPAQSVEVPLSFSPQAEGDFSSYLEIETNDTERMRFRINLFGRAYIPDISATTSVDFGYVRVGWRKRKDIIISNEKPFPFVISNIYFGRKDGFSYEHSYLFPLLLKYQETISFPVIFSPNDLTGYETQITVVALLPQSSTYSFESNQNISPKFIRINVSGYGGYPRMNVKDEINLGTIWSDESKYEIFPIENTGDTDLEVKLNIQSDVFTISAYDIVVSPGETFPLRLSFSPQGKSGNFSASLYLFSNDPGAPEKIVRVVATSRSPDVVLEGKGCSLFSFSFIIFIGIIFFIFKLVRVYGVVKLVVSFFFIQIILINEALSLNIIFSPKSGGKLFFTREPNFLAKDTVSFSNVFYISFGQLQRNIYKEEKLVQSSDIIRTSLISEFSASYSISDDSVLYASVPIGYFSGELKGIGVSDFFVGGRVIVYEGQSVSFFSDLFAGFPVGAKKFYISSSPFSLGIIGGMKIDNFGSNIGAIYGGRDIPLRSLLSGGTSIQITNKIFNSYDAYIIFPLAIKRGFVSSEISTSVGFGIDEFVGKFGVSKGLIGGFGSSGFRLFFSATANINPKANPSIKYFQASGIILDALGNRVSDCIVQIKELMLSKISRDGNFSFELPRGTYEVQVVCEGFETSKGYVSSVNPNIKINVERIQPTLITYSTDRTGIPIERDIKVRIDESEFDIQTYYVVLRGSKNISIQSGSFSRELYISKPEFVWLRINPQEAVKSEQIEHDDKSVVDTSEQGTGKENLPEVVGTRESSPQEKSEQKKSDNEERKTGDVKKNFPQEHTLSKEIKELDKEDVVRERATQIFRQKLYDIYTEKDSVVVRITITGFSLNSASLPSQAQRQLQELVDFVSKNIDKIREILIEGHTDDIGSESWNLELSYSRANSVRKHLFEKGLLIPVKIIGYSSMFPLKKSDDPQVKSINRRTEIKIFMK